MYNYEVKVCRNAHINAFLKSKFVLIVRKDNIYQIVAIRICAIQINVCLHKISIIKRALKMDNTIMTTARNFSFRFSD